MNGFPILFVLFFLVPLIEIYLLIQVGSIIGAGLTIMSVVFTAVLGAYLIRRQGTATYQRLQNKMQTREIPAREILDGFCLLVAGAFLMTPGFFTDSMGFALLIPPVRSLIYNKLKDSPQFRVVTPQGGGYPPQSNDPQVPIEGEYKKVDD